MNIQKVKVFDLKPQDFEVMLEATQSYSSALFEHMEAEKKSQQYIHLSILSELSYELVKRVNVRSRAKKAQFTIELYTAFVLFDALSFYSSQCDDHLSSARLNRVMMGVHQELPRTTDQKQLSIASSLNFDHD